jgi:hypothetical protein
MTRELHATFSQENCISQSQLKKAFIQQQILSARVFDHDSRAIPWDMVPERAAGLGKIRRKNPGKIGKMEGRPEGGWYKQGNAGNWERFISRAKWANKLFESRK